MIQVPSCPLRLAAEQAFITSSKQVSRVTLNLPERKTCCMLLETFSSEGNNTKRSCGEYQRIGVSSLYQGKMPFRYASKRRPTERSPPIASKPSSSASAGSGKSKRSSSLNIIRQIYAFLC